MHQINNVKSHLAQRQLNYQQNYQIGIERHKKRYYHTWSGMGCNLLAPCSLMRTLTIKPRNTNHKKEPKQQKKRAIFNTRKAYREEENRRVCNSASHVLAEMQEFQHKRNPLSLLTGTNWPFPLLVWAWM